MTSKNRITLSSLGISSVSGEWFCLVIEMFDARRLGIISGDGNVDIKKA